MLYTTCCIHVYFNYPELLLLQDKLVTIDLETRILLVSERHQQEIACVRQAVAQLEERLRCPVCLETARRPIYKCDEDHLVCAKCRDR